MSKSKKTNINEKNIAHGTDELSEVKEAFEKHGKTVITVFLAVLVAILGFNLYSSKKAARDVEAATKLNIAHSVTDLENIVANYDGSQAARMALISLAKQYYDSGNYDGATEKYEEFIRKYPASEMAPTAALGRVFCIEARSTPEAYKEAEKEYTAFVSKHPKSFLTPQAVLGQARCLELLGDDQGAKIIYEDFIADNGDSPWAIMADDLLKKLNHKIKNPPIATKPATSETSAEKAKPIVIQPAKEQVATPAVKSEEKNKATKEAKADANYKAAVKKSLQSPAAKAKAEAGSGDSSKGEATGTTPSKAASAAKADAGDAGQ